MFKILIADDESELLELYSELLSKSSRTIQLCDSGDKALEYVNTQVYDLVISDKKMGKTSGLDVLKAVELSNPDTVFFLVTGDSSENIVFTNSKSRVIRKPFSFEGLNTILTQLEHGL